MGDEVDKDALRTAVSVARARLPEGRWHLDDAARSRHILARTPTTPGTVALYASRPTEPGTRGLIDGFSERGWRVLLPMLRRQPDWADYESWSAMRTSWGSIQEPTGPRLGAAVLAAADLVIVPGLAVDRSGARLGTGGGWYDRALPLRSRGVTVAVLLRDEEVLDRVPTLPHDVRVDAAVTETGWIVF